MINARARGAFNAINRNKVNHRIRSYHKCSIPFRQAATLLHSHQDDVLWNRGLKRSRQLHNRVHLPYLSMSDSFVGNVISKLSTASEQEQEHPVVRTEAHDKYEAILRKSFKFVHLLERDLLMKVAMYYDEEETMNSFDKKVSSVDGVLTILSNVEARNTYESNLDRENSLEEIINLYIKLVSTLTAMRSFNIRGRGMKFRSISNEFKEAERQHRIETNSTPQHFVQIAFSASTWLGYLERMIALERRTEPETFFSRSPSQNDTAGNFFNKVLYLFGFTKYYDKVDRFKSPERINDITHLYAGVMKCFLKNFVADNTTGKDERPWREATSEHIEGQGRKTISDEPKRHNRMVVHEIESLLQRYETLYLDMFQTQSISSIDHDALLKLNRQRLQIYHTLIQAYVRIGTLKSALKAEKVLFRMVDSKSNVPLIISPLLAPNFDTFRLVMKSYLSASKEDSERAVAACEALIERMRKFSNETGDENDIWPDIDAYNTLLRVYQRWRGKQARSKGRRTIKILQEIDSRKTRDSFSYYQTRAIAIHILTSLNKENFVEKAKSLLTNSENDFKEGKTEVFPSTVCYNRVISGLMKSAHSYDDAVEIEKLLNSQISLGSSYSKPDSRTFRLLLKLWQKVGLAGYDRTRHRESPGERANNLLSRMESQSAAGNHLVKPNQIAYL